MAFFTGNFDFIDDDDEILRKETPRSTAPKPALTDIKEEEDISYKKDQEEGGTIDDAESKADDASQEPELAQVLLINLFTML